MAISRGCSGGSENACAHPFQVRNLFGSCGFGRYAMRWQSLKAWGVIRLKSAKIVFAMATVLGVGSVTVAASASATVASQSGTTQSGLRVCGGPGSRPSRAPSAWLKILKSKPTKANWYGALSDFVCHPTKSAFIDLNGYRLADEMAVPLRSGQYIAYAENAFRSGRFLEALNILDKGMTNGTITRADAGAAELRQRVAREWDRERKYFTASELEKSRTSKSWGVLVVAGDYYLARGEPAKALEFFNLASKVGNDARADDLHLSTGIALVRLGRKAEAIKQFGQVKKGTPIRDVADYWAAFVKTGIR